MFRLRPIIARLSTGGFLVVTGGSTAGETRAMRAEPAGCQAWAPLALPTCGQSRA